MNMNRHTMRSTWNCNQIICSCPPLDPPLSHPTSCHHIALRGSASHTQKHTQSQEHLPFEKGCVLLKYSRHQQVVLLTWATETGYEYFSNKEKTKPTAIFVICQKDSKDAFNLWPKTEGLWPHFGHQADQQTVVMSET